MSTTIATVRQFNRAWTQRVGALDESFLGSGRPLGPSRLLFEIGSTPGGAVVRELRDRLGLDSGYLSRLLRRLEDEGLVTTGADPDDAPAPGGPADPRRADVLGRARASAPTTWPGTWWHR